MSINVYCNSCFETKSQLNQKFFVTSCGHVFCNVCMANDRSSCKLCNIECRVLDINKDMPQEVKIMFETESIQKLVANIKKIQTFQENQARHFFEKMKPKIEEYPKYKQQIQKLFGVKKKYLEAIKKEKEIIERLKFAFRTKQITPDLFRLSGRPRNDEENRSQSMNQSSRDCSASSRNPLSERTPNMGRNLQQSREGSVTSKTSSRSGSGRQESVVSSVVLEQSRGSTIRSNISRTPLNRMNAVPDLISTPSRTQAPLLSSLMQKYNLPRSSNQSTTPNYLKVNSRSTSLNSPKINTSHSSTSSLVGKRSNYVIAPTPQVPRTPCPQNKPTHERTSMFDKAREGLLQNTLRQMNAESQMKYQAMRRQQPKF